MIGDHTAASNASHGPYSSARSDDLYVEVPDLFAQRVAIHAEEVSGPDLIAPSRRESRGQQRVLHLAKNSVIETRRGQIGVEAGEIARQVALNGRRQVVLAHGLIANSRHHWLRELGIDHDGRNGFLGVECSEPPGQVLKFADIA